jgi:hypothetical protein
MGAIAEEWNVRSKRKLDTFIYDFFSFDCHFNMFYLYTVLYFFPICETTILKFLNFILAVFCIFIAGTWGHDLHPPPFGCNFFFIHFST